MPNRLAQETSPYLLQHAHNPVDWYPWGPEALERAKREDKPILVSIGYSACHWCHVMERESFENPDVAALMNQYCINIKIDREERPDIDQIYMDAVQVLTGQGGWPLNMFLTPDGKPFYGGTYFPPRPVQGRPSWPQVLHWVNETFKTQRDKVEEQAQRITEHIIGMDGAVIKGPEGATAHNSRLEIAHKVFSQLLPRFDRRNGGFGGAPKFPNPFNLKFLLRYQYDTGNKEALEHALFSLTKMCEGGIYDHLGGGFARYSVDDYWLVPHFEKMLYDNALLVNLLAEAYQITQHPFYKNKADETLAFVQRELMHQAGGFFAALDADSEGVEGKFYTWHWGELTEILGDDATWVADYYDVSEAGNWEHVNILNTPVSDTDFANRKGWTTAELQERLAFATQKLFAERAKRVRPGLDDKVILSWNALMVSAFAKAAQAFGNMEYAKQAQQSLDFLLANLYVDGQLYHTWKGEAKYPAFLDDYACLVEALLDVYASVFEERYLTLVVELAEKVQTHFADNNGALYYYTPATQKDVIVRKRDVFDSVTPSGNSVMARNWLRLAVLTGNTLYQERGDAMLAQASAAVSAYGSSCANWACVMLEFGKPVQEVAIVGPSYMVFAKDINQVFQPHRLVMAARDGSPKHPLLQGRGETGKTLIYLCENYTCQRPVEQVAGFWEMVQK